MPITVTIPPLNRTSPTFKTDVDTFFGTTYPLFVDEANDLQIDVNNKQQMAATSAALAATKANDAENSADIASAAAITAVNAPGTLASSATSLTIGYGVASLTVEAGKYFGAGQFIIIANSVVPTNYMVGQILTYNIATGAMTVAVSITGGAGTFSSWSVSLTVAAFAPGTTVGSVLYLYYNAGGL